MKLRRHISELSEEIKNLERQRQHAPNKTIEDALTSTIDQLVAELTRCQLELERRPSRFVRLVKHLERLAVAAAFLFLTIDILLSGTAYAGTSAYLGYTYASKLHLAAYGILLLAWLRRLIARIYRHRRRIVEMLNDISDRD